MSKRTLLIASLIAIIAVGAAGVWYYFNYDTKKDNTANQIVTEATLEQLVGNSKVIVVGKVGSSGENRIASVTTTDGKETQRISTDYSINVIDQKYPTYPLDLKSFYLSLEGGRNSNGKTIAFRGVPSLEKEKEYLVFANFSKDGRLRAVGEGRGIAEISGNKYILSEGILPEAKRTFTPAELDSAIKSAAATATHDIEIKKK